MNYASFSKKVIIENNLNINQTYNIEIWIVTPIQKRCIKKC